MKKIVFLLFMTVLLISCKKEDQYFYLPPNSGTDLKYGDTLTFKSNLNNTAKYVVLKIVNGYFWVSRSSKDGIDNRPFDYYQCQISYIDTVGKALTQSQNWLVQNVQNISVPLLFNEQNTRRPDFISVCTYFSGNSIINWYNMNYNRAILNITSMKILNRQFENVASCAIDTALYQTPGRHVNKFYCNVKKGLLGFKCTNGEVFELVE
jgi:hypothetical protein